MQSEEHTGSEGLTTLAETLNGLSLSQHGDRVEGSEEIPAMPPTPSIEDLFHRVIKEEVLSDTEETDLHRHLSPVRDLQQLVADVMESARVIKREETEEEEMQMEDGEEGEQREKDKERPESMMENNEVS